MRNFVFFFSCLFLISLSIACNEKTSDKPSDETIQKDIQASVAADPQTRDSEVVVKAEQGKVKVTGKVKTPAARKQVETIAEAEPGVSDVDDQTTVGPVAPAEPTTPVPSFSAAQKIGMFAFPKNGQSSDQQLRDEFDCYSSAQQQSGVNPDTPAPVAPTAADIQAAQKQAVDSAAQMKGGRVGGAAKGAAGGAAIGAIAGDAGKGAAIGAVAGTMRGAQVQRNANAQSKQQAAAGASSQLQQNYSQELASYNQQIGTFKRAFSACLDARNYSVK